MRERRGGRFAREGWSWRNSPAGWSHPAWLSRYHFLLLFLFALLSIRPALAQDVGEVVSVVGAAEVLRKGRWQPVGAGESLTAGEVVRTGAGSRVAVLLANGSQIKLNANSQLQLKQIAPRSEGLVSTATEMLQSILRILDGEIWVRNSGEPLQIETVPATATIRGTEFNLAVGPGDAARLAVLNGLVEFSNPQGSVLVAASEQATVRVGEAPRKTVLLNPLDAVQWSLYYPDGVGDPKDRDRKRLDDPQSSRYWVQVARRHLVQGQVVAARQALDRALALDPDDALAYGLRSNIELVQNRKAQALEDAERAIAVNPSSSSAYLSLSLVKQAQFDLGAALDAARQAVALDPDNPQALVQESSLLFGMGRLKDAFALAERAKQRAPNDAMVNTVWGFLQLARNQVGEARDAFQAAIAQDSTLGLPHLGLGLVLFRRNETEAAVDEMRKATLLEPMVSLYNSYLGKAFYEIKQDRRAQKYLELAKQLDPHDPTPWFYDAIRLQSINRPIEAVESLQKSIELNDDRGVYRSRLLLDEDLAARSATLGRIYNEIGFGQLGLQEGWQAANRDPTNYSAHRLLADSYSALPQYEIARVSELLQSQLLQPINITPVSPQLAETRLLIPGAGPVTPSLYEFNPLLVRDRPTLFFSGLGGNQNTWGNDLIVSGLSERFSYSIGQFHYQSNGFRENDDLTHNIYDIFAQLAVTPDLNLQAEYRYRKTERGDLQLNFNDSFSQDRTEINQGTTRLGARYSLSPQMTVLASLMYVDRDFILNYFDSDNTLKTTETKAKGYQEEVQLLYKANDFNLVMGLGDYAIDYKNFDSLGESDDEDEQKIGYGYLNIKLPDDLIWTIGLSNQSNSTSDYNLQELNPKFGIQWLVNDHLSLRAAAFKTVKRAIAADQTIEPTQVAGFNQFFDYADGTVSKVYGVGLDVRFGAKLFGGVELSRRNLQTPIGGGDFFEFEEDQEDVYRAYLYWLPHSEWAVTAEYLYEGFEVKKGQFRPVYAGIPSRLETSRIPLTIRYFNPSGFFANLGATYVRQNVRYVGFDPSFNFINEADDRENFMLVDAGVGYRFPKRWGIVALEANNLLNEEFHFQDYSFQMNEPNTPFVPERSLFVRFSLNL